MIPKLSPPSTTKPIIAIQPKFRPTYTRISVRPNHAHVFMSVKDPSIAPEATLFGVERFDGMGERGAGLIKLL